ncbi:hypothetical protein [Paenibacillus sp. B2(2019)]|uniref:hypothetical protein n=1 Tax=Paenibacillus sp. B2(2019) TaxID=2607754 RepID=UPI00165F99CE|nr:hypothetical protein [Paenibacillus sp. B2(2019)]
MWNELALDGNVTVAGRHLTNLVEGMTSMKDKINDCIMAINLLHKEGYYDKSAEVVASLACRELWTGFA